MVGCVLFSVLSITSLVAGAMIIKKKKDREKLKKQQVKYLGIYIILIEI